MQMVQAYEFRAHFPPCALEIEHEQMGGGGQGRADNAGRDKYAIEILPEVQRLPLYICGPIILLLSITCYLAGYEVLDTLIRFFNAS